MSALYVTALVGVLLVGIIIGTLVGYRDRERGREAVFLVRIWLVRFRPALNGWLSIHNVCDRCDGELFELEAKVAEWDRISERVSR